jgi:Zn-dependent metalloprotease
LKRAAAALCLLAALSSAARAVKPAPGAREDAKRFGLGRFHPISRAVPSADSGRAFRTFNAGGRWKLRYSERTGLPASLTGGSEFPRPGGPDAAARSFLAAHADLLGVDPSILTIDRLTHGNGHHHVLYRQNYRGIPVEFASVKVHLDPNGSVLGVHSTFEPGITLPTTAAVPADAAARAAAADAGGGSVRGAPVLVVVPLESDGRTHLAWKLRVDGPHGGSWRYYVDARTGQVLLRVSIREFIGPCQSSGTVMGSVFDIDPATPPNAVIRPFNDQYVYIGDPPVRAVTGSDATFGSGFFCGTNPGKVAMSLQGPYASVSEFRGPNAHYDDGNGVWNTLATPLSSPHPYPNNANLTATLDLSVQAPHAVEFIPVFANFQVGGFDGGAGEGTGDISDDDKLIVSDGAGNSVADYIGNRGSFNGAAVHGKVMKLTLKSNDSGQASGYDISISSYLTLTNANSDGAPLSSHTWTFADTWISAKQGTNLHGEISLFYHLNKMHDYFLADVDKSSAAPIVAPVVAMAHVGPNLVNAFYDPDYDDLSFGDVNDLSPSDAFMDDATVPHHEYVHYVVQKIWPIQNYGQAGALSEANADYFSASSLDDPAIGTFVVGVLGGSGPLRQIDDTAPSAVFYNLNTPLTTGWTGEIHDDSPFLSQALWDIRRAAIAPSGLNLGHDAGRSCADGLEFQSLLYFPESFAELYDAMIQVDQLGAVAACGGPNKAQAIITNSFGAHGLLPLQGDAYEGANGNNGFETAFDISTIPYVSATIFPAADTDFYSFGAGPGLIQITMGLPANGGGLYEAYQLKLYNSARQPVASAAPPYNGFGTLDGVCDTSDCTTTSSQVSLSFNNPTGGLMYVQVIGGDSLNGSNSAVNSATPYVLHVSFPQAGALSGAVVSAHFNRDVISFAVNVSTFVSVQDWSFSGAQLRDQSHNPMPGTLTHIPRLGGDFLDFVSSQSAYGQVSGQVQLSTIGFSSRFPAAGTVYLEVFGADRLGRVSSLGQSNPINLSDTQAELTAYNNLFNPLQGQKATVKYGVSGSGHLTVKLYTVTGRYVVTLFEGDVTAGKGSVDWNGQNTAGNVVASGVYVVRAVGPGLDSTQKIAVIK